MLNVADKRIKPKSKNLDKRAIHNLKFRIISSYI